MEKISLILYPHFIVTNKEEMAFLMPQVTNLEDAVTVVVAASLVNWESMDARWVFDCLEEVW